jgi:hypothetical protein
VDRRHYLVNFQEDNQFFLLFLVPDPAKPPAARPRLLQRLQPSQTIWDMDIGVDGSAVSAWSVNIVESNLGSERAVNTSCQLLQPVSGHNLVHFQGDNQVITR